MESMESSKSALVGKLFHSFEDGKLCLQGRVVSQESEGLFLVEIYDWNDGCLYDSRLVQVSDMAGWRFYNTAEDMELHSKRYERLTLEMMGHGKEN